MSADRYNKGKLRVELIPPEAILALAEVYTKGALKYEAENWRQGLDWKECYGSLQRHALAWYSGETSDPETECNHLAHVAWNALTLLIHQQHGLGVDSRILYNRDVDGQNEEAEKAHKGSRR